MEKSKVRERREEIKQEFWSADIAWTGDKERGWFRAPRSLPLVLALLASKKLSGTKDPSRVYLELLACHRDTGVIEMGPEGEHSYAAGYVGPRANRTWSERMRILEELGFIKTKPKGNQKYGQVLLVHPTIAVQRLRDKEKISDEWWAAYRQRQIQATEPAYEKVMERNALVAEVFPLKTPVRRKKKVKKSGR